MSGITDKMGDAANYVKDTVSQGTNKASSEVNKEQAKDSNASLGDRAGAAKDYVGDKASEKKDEASATANKESAKH